MDVNERTSVHPYGKEVQVLSPPNYYLSKIECFSLFPAPLSQAKHLQPQLNPLGSQMLSLILEHNPQRKKIWDADQAGFWWLPWIWKPQITARGFSPLFFRKSRHFLTEAQKVSAEPNIQTQTLKLSFLQILVNQATHPASSMETIIVRDPISVSLYRQSHSKSFRLVTWPCSCITVLLFVPLGFRSPGMSPNTRVQAHGATLVHLRWMFEGFSLLQDHLMTARIMPVIPTAHTAQRDFFFLPSCSEDKANKHF